MKEINLENLVVNKEKVYFICMLLVSLLIYFLLFISIIGAIYVLFFALFFFIMQGFAIGNLKQNSVKITEEQFSDIYEKIKNYSAKLGLDLIPDIYLTQSGGLLNAFATRFLCKDIVVIYSDVLELAYESGENAVNFIIAHELAHVKRKHLSKIKYIACAQMIPFLNTAYSRACEVTCDRIAAVLIEKMPLDGLLVLCAGKKLYKKVDTDVFLKNSKLEKDFWSWVAEITSTHPNLATRIKNIATMKL